MDALRQQLKQLIVTTLDLEVPPESIDDQAPLFAEHGLGLESLEALELAVAIEYEFGIEQTLDAEQARTAFHSVETLANFVAENRQQ